MTSSKKNAFSLKSLTTPVVYHHFPAFSSMFPCSPCHISPWALEGHSDALRRSSGGGPEQRQQRAALRAGPERQDDVEGTVLLQKPWHRAGMDFCWWSRKWYSGTHLVHEANFSLIFLLICFNGTCSLQGNELENHATMKPPEKSEV